MNATEAINKITDLLGLRTKQSFMVTKLVDNETEITNNKEGETLEVGDELFIVKESTLVPAPEGEHITREGVKISVGADSVIYKIEEEKEQDGVTTEIETEIKDEEVDMMSSATLADGTKIETDEQGDFAVGQQLYVITEDGSRAKAPEGEHTTESGITITTDAEGVITGVKYPDEPGEGSLEDMKKDMEKMKQAMGEIVSLFTEMNKMKEDFEKTKKEFNEFKKQPDRSPVVKNYVKENILDLKLELIKNSKR